MTETFTPNTDLTVKPTIKEEKIPFIPFAEPSNNVIRNILNYSKNLEIKTTRFLPAIEILRS